MWELFLLIIAVAVIYTQAIQPIARWVRERRANGGAAPSIRVRRSRASAGRGPVIAFPGVDFGGAGDDDHTDTGDRSTRKGGDMWAASAKFLVFTSTAAGVVFFLMGRGVTGWLIFGLALLVALVVVWVLHGRTPDGARVSMWHSAPRLLVHEIRGLLLLVSPVQSHHHPIHFRRHRERRAQIVAQAAVAHQRDAEIAEERKQAALYEQAAKLGRAALEAALNRAVPLSERRTEKRREKVPNGGEKGGFHYETVAHEYNATLARVVHRYVPSDPETGDMVAVYRVKWVDSFDEKIARAWANLAESAHLILRASMGVSPERISYVEPTGELRVVMVPNTTLTLEDFIPKFEEVEDEPPVVEIDDETPVVLGGPPLSVLPIGKRSVGRPAEGRTISRKLVSAVNSLVGAEDGAAAVAEDVSVGPASVAVTLRPPAGVRGSALLKLGQDLEIELPAPGLRIVPSPDRAGCVVVEIPRASRDSVAVRSVLASPKNREAARRMELPVAFGQDASGSVIVADLAALPNLLVAGTPGSGKSVGLHDIALSMITSRSTEQVRLQFVDPKVVEFPIYDHLPHVLAPCISEVSAMEALLGWMLAEMERRYRLFAKAGVLDLASFNKKHPEQAMPRIVSLWDEVADLMLAGDAKQRKAIEADLSRLLAKARASGLHVVLATQRPTKDVVPGLIKANSPARWAFAVQSGMDSQIILDGPGAETLTGKGDSLLLLLGAKSPARLQAPWAPREAVEDLVAWWSERQPVEYDPGLVAALASAGMAINAPWSGDSDSSEDADASDDEHDSDSLTSTLDDILGRIERQHDDTDDDDEGLDR